MLTDVGKEELLGLSRKAAKRAYCPYSKFHVGCALIDEIGIITTGCNVENASYGLTICSERCAIFNMVASGATKFLALAVSCPDAGKDAPAKYKMPCGACRQVLAEFAMDGAIVLVDGVGEFTMEQLLPEAFRL